MFTVEWLKKGIPVHQESMLGASMEATLTVARKHLAMAKKASGATPDTLRVTDHVTNRAAIEKVPRAKAGMAIYAALVILVAVAIWWMFVKTSSPPVIPCHLPDGKPCVAM